MRAPRRVASWPIAHVLGPGHSLLRGAASRPIARLTSRVSVPDFPWARKAHQSSRTKAPGREPPSLPNYATAHVPPAASWRSAGLLLSMTVALLVVNFAYHHERPLFEAQRPEETSDKPMQRDQDWERMWTPFSKDLEEYEADANETLRPLYRETREAIAREDWSAARRALLSAWRATDGLEADGRFEAFAPRFLFPLFDLVFLPRLSGNDPFDFSTAISLLAQEILPVVDEARNRPGVERESFEWYRFLRISMRLRAKTGREILERQKECDLSAASLTAPNGAVVTAESILSPPRKEFVALMEDIRARGHNSFGAVYFNLVVSDYWTLNHDIAKRDGQHVEAIRFARYSVMISNDKVLPQHNCGRLQRLGDALLTYSETKKESVDGIRPEFKDFNKVMDMPSDQLAAGSQQELISAALQVANLCLRYSNRVVAGQRREIAQLRARLLAAEVCSAKNDPAQCDHFMQQAENSAETLAKRYGDKFWFRPVKRIRRSYWEMHGAIRKEDSRDDHWSSND